MKKALKWILIGLGCLLFLIVAGTVIFTYFGGEDKLRAQQGKTRRILGKSLAVSISTQMEMAKIETEVYPPKDKLDAALAEFGAGGAGNYSYGVAADNEEIAKLCPDCVISSAGYKIAIFGNIDQDSELDVMTVDNDRKIMLIQDDLGEEKAPVDISLKKE